MVLIVVFMDKKEVLLDCFRPLTGIMVLITKIFKDVDNLKDYSFRPLTGIMVLIKKNLSVMDFIQAVFPSPYRDYGSYHSSTLYRIYVTTVSFRPLTGIMVLIG